MPKSFIECRTTIKNGKRRLAYHNNRTKKTLPIVVGPLGGLSVKSPNSKSRRYVKKACKKNSSKSFWETAKSLQKKKAKK